MRSKNDLYHFQAELDAANFLIHQISRETGLKLASYLIEPDGFYALSLNYVTELLCSEPDKSAYRFYSYDKLGTMFYDETLADTIRELKRAYKEREALLGDFQTAWNRITDHGEGVAVHYGLRQAYIQIPLETIVKYGAYIAGNYWETVLFGNHTPNVWEAIASESHVPTLSLPDGIMSSFGHENAILLCYRWTERGLATFDNRSDFLGWKVADYQNRCKTREDLTNYNETIHYFQARESKIFPDVLAPL